MPQRTWLGPLIFILLINDLSTTCMMHKFVDDITLTEVVERDELSNMSFHFSNVVGWSSDNLMNINYKKTKDMVLGILCKNPPSEPVVNGSLIERVSVFKLLGVYIEHSLKWNSHVDYICAKASSRLYFLKRLKRCATCINDMLHFYNAVIRPVLEYACPVWHTGLT